MSDRHRTVRCGNPKCRRFIAMVDILTDEFDLRGRKEVEVVRIREVKCSACGELQTIDIDYIKED